MRADPRVTFRSRLAVWLVLTAVAMTLPPGTPSSDPVAPQAHLALSKLSRVRAVFSPERLPGALSSNSSEKRNQRGKPVAPAFSLLPLPGRPVKPRRGPVFDRFLGTIRPLRC